MPPVTTEVASVEKRTASVRTVRTVFFDCESSSISKGRMVFSLMKLVRILNGHSLDALSNNLACRKSTLSVIEHWPAKAGKRLRRKLERHYSTSYTTLSRDVNASAIASWLLTHLSEPHAAQQSASKPKS